MTPSVLGSFQSKNHCPDLFAYSTFLRLGRSSAARGLDMAYSASRGVLSAMALLLPLLGVATAAERPKLLKNIELCNGADRDRKSVV